MLKRAFVFLMLTGTVTSIDDGRWNCRSEVDQGYVGHFDWEIFKKLDPKGKEMWSSNLLKNTKKLRTIFRSEMMTRARS